MKHILFLTVVAIVFTACATPATALNTSIPSTETITLSPVPSQTPTIAPTPTETPDPNAPPGYTGKDAQGNYTKPENGVTVMWNTELNMWVRHIMVNDEGVPLLAVSGQAHSNGVSDQLFLHVNISDKVPGFEKVESLSFHSGAGDSNGPTFGNVFLLDLQKVLQKRIGPAYKGFQQLDSGDISLSFTTSEGSKKWKIGQGSTIVVDILDRPIGIGFQSWKCPMWKNPNKNYIFQTRLFTDDQGNLYVWLIPDPTIPIDQYTREDDMAMYLFGVASIVNDSDQTQQFFSMKLATYSAVASDSKLPPYFDFGPPQ